MRSFLLIANFLLAASGAAAAACIAPDFPDISRCGECPSAETMGTQCKRAGGQKWMSCYKSFEDCCKDGQIRPQDVTACLKNSGVDQNQDLGPYVPSLQLSPEVPIVDHKYCTQVAAIAAGKDNAYCMKLCDTLINSGTKKPEDDSEFSANCAWNHWHGADSESGRTVVDGDCFEKWIYGYSESDRSSYDMNEFADTPAQCQLLCQLDDDCENWAWVSDLYMDTGADRVRRCSLKNRSMVRVPLSIITDTAMPSNLDTDYCNYGMPYLCSIDHYKCLQCDGKKRCVWESDMHISGWKHCGRVTTGCDPLPELTTPKPPAPTTPKPPAPTTPKPPAPTTPKPPASTTPKPPASTTPKPPASTTLKPPASTTPKPPASTPGAPAPTTSKSPVPVTPPLPVTTSPKPEKPEVSQTDSADSDSDSSDGKTHSPGGTDSDSDSSPSDGKTGADSDSSSSDGKTGSDSDSSSSDEKTHAPGATGSDSDSSSSDGDKSTTEVALDTPRPTQPIRTQPIQTQPTRTQPAIKTQQECGGETTEAGCHPPPTQPVRTRPQECHPESPEEECRPRPCHCHHHHNCDCHKGQLFVRVGERPKKLLIKLEN